jgi:hypothetical protein
MRRCPAIISVRPCRRRPGGAAKSAGGPLRGARALSPGGAREGGGADLKKPIYNRLWEGSTDLYGRWGLCTLMCDIPSWAIPSSTSLSAKRRTVHLALPVGGGEHANATSLASKSPSNLMGFRLAAFVFR